MKIAKSPISHVLGFLLSLLVAFGFWHWSSSMIVPLYTSIATAKAYPLGNNSDIYPRWLGTRELLLHHRDPYSVEVTREIQIGFYGRALVPNSSDPTDQENFVYPLYVSFLLAPTVDMPFGAVKELFRWLILLCVAFSVPLWMFAVRFRAGLLPTISAMVLAVSSFAGVIEYAQQNLTALVLLFLAAAAAMAARDSLFVSGCLLALSTIKPQLSGILILWFLLWACAAWKERKRLVWGFVASMSALLAGAQVLSPHWIPRFLVALGAYHHYATDRTIMTTVLGPILGTLGNVSLIVALIIVCWCSRQSIVGSLRFSWALAWVTIATIALIPRMDTHYQLLLIPALLVMLAERRTIWQMGAIPRSVTNSIFACQLWQWLAASGLSLLSLTIPPERIRAAAEIPLLPLYAPPVLALAAIAVTTRGVFEAMGREELTSPSMLAEWCPPS
jgi:hypothetical protein